jgi:hypothetical protein
VQLQHCKICLSVSWSIGFQVSVDGHADEEILVSGIDSVEIFDYSIGPDDNFQLSELFIIGCMRGFSFRRLSIFFDAWERPAIFVWGQGAAYADGRGTSGR